MVVVLIAFCFVFKKKEGLMSAKDHPGAAIGITVTSALFLMPGFFFHDYHTHSIIS